MFLCSTYLVATDLPPNMLVWAELGGVCAVAPKIDAVLVGDEAFPNEPNEFEEKRLLPAEKGTCFLFIYFFRKTKIQDTSKFCGQFWTIFRRKYIRSFFSSKHLPLSFSATFGLQTLNPLKIAEASAELLTVAFGVVVVTLVVAVLAPKGDSALAFAKLKPIALGVATEAGVKVCVVTGVDVDEVSGDGCTVDATGVLGLVGVDDTPALADRNEKFPIDGLLATDTEATIGLFSLSIFDLSVDPEEKSVRTSNLNAFDGLATDGS